MTPPASSDPSSDFDVLVVSRSHRCIATILRAALFLGTPALSLWLLIVFDPPAGPVAPVLACMGGLASLAGAESLLRNSARATLRIHADRVHLTSSAGRAEELRLDGLDAAVWRCPLPGAGFRLRARTAAPDASPVHFDVLTESPGPLLNALARRGAHAVAHAPSVAFADARFAAQKQFPLRSRWQRFAFRNVLFALLPTIAFVYTHQYIAWGGPFGEYYLAGLGPWLRTFARFWLALGVILLFLSGLCRALCELAAAIATRVAPSQAARTRRVANRVFAWLYYAGVPALTALRYAPWAD